MIHCIETIQWWNIDTLCRWIYLVPRCITRINPKQTRCIIYGGTFKPKQKKPKTLPPTKYPKTLHQNTFNTKKTQIPTEGTPQTNQNNADQFEGEPPTHTPSLEQTPNPPLNNSIPKHPKLLSRIFRNEKTVKFDYICLHFINDHIGGNCWKMFLYVTIAEIRQTVLLLSNKHYQLFQDWKINPKIRRKKISKKLEKDWTKRSRKGQKLDDGRKNTKNMKNIN